MKNKTLFLTLKIFSATGGIEKVCRIAGKALNEINLQGGGRTKIFCMHDRQKDVAGNTYFPDELFTGFGAAKIKFVRKAVAEGRKTDIVMLSHINLLLVGWLIKLLNPKVKLILLAHGIEVWEPLNSIKKRMLNKCDLILAVSRFTKEKMISLHGLERKKLKVFNNCLDPNLTEIINKEKDRDLLDRYGFTKDNIILFTLTRLATSERYKGYEKVIEAMKLLVTSYPELRYLLAGKYDTLERLRIEELIKENKLEAYIVLAGFIQEAEVAAHFNLANIYIMPSVKEGFGIVFIEAMHYGKPVIAGNKDGSVDALANGEFGLLVDPDDINAITEAIKKMLQNPQQFIPDQKKLEEKFGYSKYKEGLRGVVES